MKIIDTKFKGLKIIKVNNYKDKRGNLKVTFNEKNINFTICINSSVIKI